MQSRACVAGRTIKPETIKVSQTVAPRCFMGNEDGWRNGAEERVQAAEGQGRQKGRKSASVPPLCAAPAPVAAILFAYCFISP